MVTEKKKIIFIAVIIGLFLFIAIALPLTLLSSNERFNTVAVSGIPKPVPPQTQNNESDPLKPVTVDTLSAIPPSTQSNAQNVIINQYGAEGISEPSGTKVVSNPDGTLTINVLPAVPTQQPVIQTPPSTAPQQQPPVSTPPEPKPALQTPPKQPVTSESKPVTQPKTIAPVAPQTPPKQQTTAPAETKKPAQTSEKTTIYYWIQTGAFSKQAGAENAKKALIERGIKDASIRIVPSGIYFRVRVGPYSKTEADYWYKLIKIMDGLEESYISQTQTPK